MIKLKDFAPPATAYNVFRVKLPCHRLGAFSAPHSCGGISQRFAIVTGTLVPVLAETYKTAL